MLSFSHTLISLPLTLYLQNPFLIFIAAFILHLLMDSLLHWNIYPTKFKSYPYLLVLLDISSGLIASWLIFTDHFLTVPVLAAIAGGNAPDVLHGLWDMLGHKIQNTYFSWIKPFFVFHDHLQLETTRVWYGLIWQVIFIAIALILLRW